MKNETQHLMALQLRKFLSLVILPFIVGLAFQFNLSSTVFAKDKPSELVDQRSGSGLSSQTMLTENEQAWLDRKHTVRVRVGNVPPYHMSSPEPHGISVDYLKLIGKRFGINFNFVPSPIGWQEAVDDLTGERKWCDLLATIARTPEREKEISFTKDYIFSPWVIINRTDSKFVSIMQDLNGKNVAVERGFIILNLIKDSYPQIKIVAFDKSIDALRSVATGASDAYVGNLTGATYLIQNNGLNNLKIAAPTPFGTHNQAMGVRKDWPELTSIINKALMAMPDAEETEIRNRWLSIRYEYGVNMKQVLSWIAGLAAIFSLIFGVTFIWNRRLKTEIENRKQAEEKILEQRNLSSKYLQIAGVMMCALNSAGEVTLMNKKGLDILGYEDEQEILGKNWFDISLPKNVAADVKLVFHQLMSGNIQPVEYYENPILTKTGEERIVAFHNTVLRDKEDNISGILSSGEDITNRKREEEELRFQNEIMTNMAEALYLVRMEDGIIVFSNTIFEKMFGYEYGEMIGKHVSIVNAPSEKNPEEIARGIMAELCEKGSWQGEVNNIRKDGKIFWCYASVSVFDHSKYGRVLISFHTDITERKQAEVALRELNERLSMALEVGNTGVWEWDLTSDKVRFDDRFHKILGYASGELPNTLPEWLPYHHPEDIPVWMPKARAYLQGDSAI